MQLVRLGDAIVILVLPESQRRENGIVVVYTAIPITPIFCLVVFGQSEESVRL